MPLEVRRAFRSWLTSLHPVLFSDSSHERPNRVEVNCLPHAIPRAPDEMKSRIFAVVAVVAVVLAIFLRWQLAAPRREALQALENLHATLMTGSANLALEQVLLPQAWQDRTRAEQGEFLVKALHDEITPGGIQVLKQRAAFGSLTNLFPGEASKWAAQAGVQPEACVAFRLDHPEFRTEVVLLKQGERLRVLRCNNVTRIVNTPQR